MAKGHSKKRNSALLYDFLVRKISSSLIEGDEKTANRALKILKTSFKPGSELYREFRLINALAAATVSNPSTATSVIQEAKNAVRTHDYGELDREKSLLIRNINHQLNEDSLFYEQSVPQYRILATVQTLVNEWRRPTGDIEKVALYEDVLTNHLLAPKTPEVDGGLVESSTIDSRLIVKAMTKRLNERYSGVLTPFQRDIVRMYALSTGDHSSLKTRLSEVKTGLIQEIDKYVGSSSEDSQSFAQARQMVLNEDLNGLNDEMITRFMGYSSLLDELRANEGGQDE